MFKGSQLVNHGYQEQMKATPSSSGCNFSLRHLAQIMEGAQGLGLTEATRYPKDGLFQKKSGSEWLNVGVPTWDQTHIYIYTYV